MDETSVLRRVWLRMASACTLFRVQTGKAWVANGKPRHITHGGERGIFLPNAQPIALGFSLVSGEPVAGTSDLVGWTKIQITPAMVGHTVPVFTTFEAKESGGGHIRTEQRHFTDVVKTAGGLSAIVNSPDAAAAAYQDFLNRLDQKLV